jgi:hypothetical protein
VTMFGNIIDWVYVFMGDMNGGVHVTTDCCCAGIGGGSGG